MIEVTVITLFHQKKLKIMKIKETKVRIGCQIFCQTIPVSDNTNPTYSYASYITLPINQISHGPCKLYSVHSCKSIWNSFEELWNVYPVCMWWACTLYNIRSGTMSGTSTRFSYFVIRLGGVVGDVRTDLALLYIENMILGQQTSHK